MFLAAAQEYPDFMFRTVSLDQGTDLTAALPQVLNSGLKLIQIIYQGPEALTQKAVVEAAPFNAEPSLSWRPAMWW